MPVDGMPAAQSRQEQEGGTNQRYLTHAGPSQLMRKKKATGIHFSILFKVEQVGVYWPYLVFFMPTEKILASESPRAALIFPQSGLPLNDS